MGLQRTVSIIHEERACETERVDVEFPSFAALKTHTHVIEQLDSLGTCYGAFTTCTYSVAE